MMTEQITITSAEPIVNGHPAVSRRGSRVVAHPKFPYAVVMLAAIVAHGLLLLNDGIYWDGWPMFMMLRDGNREDLLRYFVEAGLPMRAYMHYAIGSFPGIVFGYKLVSFLSIAVSSLVIYRICDESGSLRRWESLLVAMIFLLHPAFQISFELSMAPYLMLYCFFLLSAYMALHLEERSGAKHLLLRVLALVGFFLSYNVNSLLLFYFGFLLYWGMQLEKGMGFRWRNLVRQGMRHLDFILLPFLFWGVQRVFFPAQGQEYHDYNQFHLSLRGIYMAGVATIGNAIAAQLRETWSALGELQLLWLLALVAGYRIFRRHHSRFAIDGGRRGGIAIIGAGVLLLLLGTVPYVIVAKPPSIHGYDTRHALLIALPIALVVVGILRLLFTDRAMRLSSLGMGLVLSLLLGFTILQVRNYLAWEARWIHDRSLMANLATIPEPQGVSVYFIDDHYRLVSEPYWPIELPAMLRLVWKGEGRIALDAVSRPQLAFLQGEGSCLLIHRYSMGGADPHGCQGQIDIRRGRQSYGNAGLVGRYILHRFFTPGSMDQFLRTVTDVEVRKLPESGGKPCP